MSRNYDRRAVEALVPTLWDEVSAYGIKRDDLPDPGMPKAKSNPAHGNTLYAMLADIQSAWKKADLPQVERQALLMRFGLDYTQAEIGQVQGTSHSTALRRIERGIGRLTAWLNGDSYDDEYEPTAEGDV